MLHDGVKWTRPQMHERDSVESQLVGGREIAKEIVEGVSEEMRGKDGRKDEVEETHYLCGSVCGISSSLCGQKRHIGLRFGLLPQGLPSQCGQRITIQGLRFGLLPSGV